MITIKDIANRLGIAPSTVSKGLNDANDISPELGGGLKLFHPRILQGKANEKTAVVSVLYHISVIYGYYVEESAKYHLPTLIENGATAILCGNDL